MMKIAGFVGTRPEIIKMCTVIEAIVDADFADLIFAHSGQHHAHELSKSFIKELSAGAMLYRTELSESFSWHPEMCDFEDEDESLQILRGGKWKQVIVPKGRPIHDQSWLGQIPSYERQRFDGLGVRRSYRSFRRKSGLRFDLRTHILHEIVYPILGLTRCKWLVSSLHEFTQMRVVRAFQSRT